MDKYFSFFIISCGKLSVWIIFSKFLSFKILIKSGSYLYSFSSSKRVSVILFFSCKSSVISRIITFRVASSLSIVEIYKALYKENEKIIKTIICMKKW